LHAEWVDEAVVLIHTEHAVGAEALDGEGACHADFLFVLVGLVVEVFEFGLGGDGLVDFLLPGDAGGPELGEQVFSFQGPVFRALSRQFPLLRHAPSRKLQTEL
jgi:hypothetical protein